MLAFPGTADNSTDGCGRIRTDWLALSTNRFSVWRRFADRESQNPVTEMATEAAAFTGRCQAEMLSRLLLNAAVDESNADNAAAADADDTVAAASAMDASALALPVTPDDGTGGGLIMVWLIALLVPLIALILVVLVRKSSILPRDGGGVHRKYGYGRLTNS
jgi:hypothetical protein